MTTAHTVRGIGLIEVVIGVSIMTAALLGVVTIFHSMVRITLSQTNELRAIYLLEEGAEAMRSIRDTSWDAFSAISLDAPLYLSWTGSGWVMTSAPDQIDGLYRTVTLSSAYRDASDDLAPSGTLDSEARRVEVVVAWDQEGATTTKGLSLYLINLFE